ncbi:hypothetical protein CJU90_1101 [Yarrowia sp. C11]|nr:hypothetical protein CKK34_2514 [Yarrowia sp. E02]KAG5373403.1 hypothetical protein CJU90_1101 [Yarrowia sp. C11]
MDTIFYNPPRRIDEAPSRFFDLQNTYNSFTQAVERNRLHLEKSQVKYLNPELSPIQQRGLSLVLEDKKQDFVITSEGDGRFPVHSYLLNGLWPFFKTATTIDMVEKESKTLHLPYSKECVQVVVDFFYAKQILMLTTDVASGLLVVASIYDIPELKKLATKSIMTEKSWILKRP